MRNVQELSEKCCQTEEKLKKAEEELLKRQQTTRISDSEQELNQRVQEAKASARSAIAWAEEVETRAKKIKEQLLLAKTKVGKWLDAKDYLIQQLRQQ